MAIRIDTSILSEELGIKVIDNGNGYLDKGDFLIKNPSITQDRYTVQAEDLSSDLALIRTLNKFSEGRTKINVISAGTETYMTATTRSHPGFLRVYEIKSGSDEVIASVGAGVKPLVPFSLSQSHLRQNDDLSALGVLPTMGSSRSYADVPCDKLPSEKQHGCYQKEDKEAQIKALKSQANDLKNEIRTIAMMYESTLLLEKIGELKSINKELSLLEDDS